LKAKPFELLYPQNRIEAKIRELGRRISSDYAGKKPVLLGVLKGCFIFIADLVRTVTVPVEIDFVWAHSYGDRVDPGQVKLFTGPIVPLKGRHVLLVEGVVDTGLTAQSILDSIRRMEPASVEIVTLLDKRGRREVDLAIKYAGFAVGDDFVIGYGLDHGEFYRNLPFIGKVIEKQQG